MIISATDFQLSVNEYFTRLMKGEEVIIERYGKKFAVLMSYDKYEQMVADLAVLDGVKSSHKDNSIENSEILSFRDYQKLLALTLEKLRD